VLYSVAGPVQCAPLEPQRGGIARAGVDDRGCCGKARASASCERGRPQLQAACHVRVGGPVLQPGHRTVRGERQRDGEGDQRPDGRRSVDRQAHLSAALCIHEGEPVARLGTPPDVAVPRTDRQRRFPRRGLRRDVGSGRSKAPGRGIGSVDAPRLIDPDAHGLSRGAQACVVGGDRGRGGPRAVHDHIPCDERSTVAVRVARTDPQPLLSTAAAEDQPCECCRGYGHQRAHAAALRDSRLSHRGQRRRARSRARTLRRRCGARWEACTIGGPVPAMISFDTGAPTSARLTEGARARPAQRAAFLAGPAVWPCALIGAHAASK